jgi:hypothetical protein
MATGRPSPHLPVCCCTFPNVEWRAQEDRYNLGQVTSSDENLHRKRFANRSDADLKLDGVEQFQRIIKIDFLG